MTTQPLGIILDQPIVEDPPHNASGRTSRWDPVAQAVKAQPGVWLRVAHFPPTSTGNASSGISALRKRGVEAVSRLTPDGKHRALYARYTPDKATASKAAAEPASDGDPTPVQIVQTVTAAEDDDVDPVVAVVDRYGVSRPRARILIDKARKAGLL